MKLLVQKKHERVDTIIFSILIGVFVVLLGTLVVLSATKKQQEVELEKLDQISQKVENGR